MWNSTLIEENTVYMIQTYYGDSDSARVSLTIQPCTEYIKVLMPEKHGFKFFKREYMPLIKLIV